MTVSPSMKTSVTLALVFEPGSFESTPPENAATAWIVPCPRTRQPRPTPVDMGSEDATQ